MGRAGFEITRVLLLYYATVLFRPAVGVLIAQLGPVMYSHEAL